jgi:hypothetical protein
MHNHAQQMQGKRMVGLLMQYLLQQMFRFLQEALRPEKRFGAYAASLCRACQIYAEIH